MDWLSGLFRQRNSQTQPPSVDNPEEQNSTTVVQVVVEETIMAIAQWLIALVNHTMQPKPTVQPTTPSPVEDVSVVDQTVMLQTVLSQVSTLVEKLYRRDQEFISLQNRLDMIEALVQSNSDLEQQVEGSSYSIAALDQRLTQVEQSIQEIHTNVIELSLAKTQTSTQQLARLENRLREIEQAIAQNSADETPPDRSNLIITALEQRVIHLEKLLVRFRAVPKVVESNYKAIASIQRSLPGHLTQTSSEQNGEHNSLRTQV